MVIVETGDWGNFASSLTGQRGGPSHTHTHPPPTPQSHTRLHAMIWPGQGAQTRARDVPVPAPALRCPHQNGGASLCIEKQVRPAYG